MRSFFSEKENNRAIDAIMGVMEHINTRSSQIGTEKRANCKFTNQQVLSLLMLFPLFVVRNAYRHSTIGALFRETTGNTLELSAADRIWEHLLDTILEIAEIKSVDASELLSAVIDGNPKFHKLYQMYQLVA